MLLSREGRSQDSAGWLTARVDFFAEEILWLFPMSSSRRKRIRFVPLVVIGSLAAILAPLALSVVRGPNFIRVGVGEVITIHTDELQPDAVKFYSYQDSAGKKLRFLLARDSDSRLHAAIDACRRCYMYHEGYESSSGQIICRFCGNRYRLEAMEAGLASCVPVKLPIRIAQHTVSIDSADLEGKRGLF